jgi:hypothetical protein
VFTTKAYIKIFFISSYNGRRDYWFSDWLYTPREDGKPRVLILDGYKRLGPHPQLSHSIFINHIAMVCKIISEQMKKGRKNKFLYTKNNIYDKQ